MRMDHFHFHLERTDILIRRTCSRLRKSSGHSPAGINGATDEATGRLAFKLMVGNPRSILEYVSPFGLNTLKLESRVIISITTLIILYRLTATMTLVPNTITLSTTALWHQDHQPHSISRSLLVLNLSQSRKLSQGSTCCSPSIVLGVQSALQITPGHTLNHRQSLRTLVISRFSRVEARNST